MSVVLVVLVNESFDVVSVVLVNDSLTYNVLNNWVQIFVTIFWKSLLYEVFVFKKNVNSEKTQSSR